MRPGATALAVFVAPLIALPLAAAVGGAADLVVSGDVPDLTGLLFIAADALVLGYLPAVLFTALLLVPLSRAFSAAGAVGAFSYFFGGVLTAAPLLLVLPLVEPLAADLWFDGYSAPVFWGAATVVLCVSAWLTFWAVARPDLSNG